jgi:SAM-dependent methyltransferase
MNETIETNRNWVAYWTNVLDRTGADDLIRQVGRTIGGVPVPQEQIELVVWAVAQRLSLSREDVLLDLCCGNGLVTAPLSELCRAVVGVDYSAELIQVAQERLAKPNITYVHRCAHDLHPTDFLSGVPTKVCMNAALQHFTVAMLEQLLRSLRKLTPHDLTLYFTDVPDAAKLRAFYNTPARWAEFEQGRAARTEALGTWWGRDHIVSLFETAGYAVSIIDVEPERHTAHYRFDVLARLAPDARRS